MIQCVVCSVVLDRVLRVFRVLKTSLRRVKMVDVDDGFIRVDKNPINLVLRYDRLLLIERGINNHEDLVVSQQSFGC